VIAEPRPPAPVLEAIRAPFRAAAQEGGAVRVEPPAVQPLNLLLDLLGEAMRARLLLVQTGGAEACLRPDFTVPVAREHLARGGAAGRYVYEGAAFRAAPAGSARPQEFLQIGLEAIGAADAAATDAEIASLAWRGAAAGGRTDLSLLMGDSACSKPFCAVSGSPRGCVPA
jgi:ATP phosphoribosyltransferase regulatory subunit